MKTKLIILTLLLATVGLNAQNDKIFFGVRGGMNISNLSGDLDMDAKIGYNFGATIDYALSQNAYLMSGLDFGSKGAKKSVMGNKVSMNLLYLQLPIHFGYKLQIAESTKLVFRAGPYLAYGVGGKATIEIESQKEEGNSFSTGGFKEFDFGLGLGVGAEFGKIGINLGYDFGLINALDTDGLIKSKNGNFYVGLGYKF